MAGTLYYGDNLSVMRERLASESVDLVYLDPPFQSGRDYNVIFRSATGHEATAQVRAFEDTWGWGDEAARAFEDCLRHGGGLAEAMRALRALLGECDTMAYLAMMAPRLSELRRIMKPTGSIYLHCDPTASHYLKLVMDAVFGAEHFRNEIIWKRTNAKKATVRWPRLHDVLLFYGKGPTVTFNPIMVQGDQQKIPHTLVLGPDGKKYQTYELTAPNLRYGETGKEWRGFQPAKMGRCWANPPSVMDEWDRQGLIHWPKKGGWPRRRAASPFEPKQRMITVGDVWNDINRLNQAAKERLGYPTQKPEALLDRIIEASTNPGDVVLDPFCGCGTAIASAERLGRPWVGIDITHLAVNLIRNRLVDAHGEGVEFDVVGEPVTVEGAAQLAKDDPYQFQWWFLGQLGARAHEQKKGADRGIDGKLFFTEDWSRGRTRAVVFSVKGGKTGPDHVRDLRGVVERVDAPIGVLLTLREPTRAMRKEASSAGFYESPWGRHPRLQILSAKDVIEHGKGLDGPVLHLVNKTYRRAPKALTALPEQVELQFGTTRVRTQGPGLAKTQPPPPSPGAKKTGAS